MPNTELTKGPEAPETEKAKTDAIEALTQANEKIKTLQLKISEDAENREKAIAALTRKLEICEAFAKAEILHTRLSAQEELSDKISENKALQKRLKQLQLKIDSKN